MAELISCYILDQMHIWDKTSRVLRSQLLLFLRPLAFFFFYIKLTKRKTFLWEPSDRRLPCHSPAHQEHTETGQEERDENADPDVGWERGQHAEGAVHRFIAFTQNEAETGLDKRRGHVHNLLPCGGHGQRGHCQVSFLFWGTTKSGSDL